MNVNRTPLYSKILGRTLSTLFKLDVFSHYYIADVKLLMNFSCIGFLSASRLLTIGQCSAIGILAAFHLLSTRTKHSYIMLFAGRMLSNVTCPAVS